MKPNFTKSLLVMLLGMLTVSTAYAQLSGSYTIGSGTGYDYASVAAAATDLTSNGVSGPVTFKIADGTYTGQVTMGSGITGTSATNTITFEGDSKDSSLVTLSNNNYTVYFTGTDFVTFKYITFSSTHYNYNVYLNSGSDNNRFINCRMLGLGTSYTFYNIYNYYSENNKFINCRVVGGYYGIYCQGSGSGTSASEGLVIDGCKIVNHYYYGIYTYYQQSPLITNSVVDSCQQQGYGVYSFYQQGGEISNNQFFNCYYGLMLYYMNNTGSDTATMVVNNISKNNLYYGLYSYYSEKVNYYHNVFEGGSNNYAAYITTNGSTDLRFANNIFKVDGGYYGFYMYLGSTTNYPDYFDYNDYVFSNYTYFAYFCGSFAANLSALQGLNSKYNQNCVEVDPDWMNPKDGRTYAPGLNNVGVDVGIKTDIDGGDRPNTLDKGVDIGANDYYLSPYDLDVFSLVSPLSVSLTSNIITAQFRNAGSQTITNSDVYVDYSIDSGSTWIRDTLSITSLAPGKIEQFDFTKKWTPTRAGYFGISIRIATSVTGDPDLKDQEDYYACSGISGTYTIGKRAGADFSTFEDAIKTLNCGISGPVAFNVQGGTYTERIVLNELLGASSTNTVTFVSPSVDSVTIQYTATSNADQNTIQFNGADYVSFENFTIEADGTYGFTIHMMNQSNYNRFEDCVIEANSSVTSTFSNPIVISGNQSSYYQSGDNGNYNMFYNNEVIGGYFGISVYGSSQTDMAEGNEFINNNITKMYYYGTYFYYVSGTIFHDNRIEDHRYQYNYGIYSYYTANMDIQRNYVEAYYGNFLSYLNYYNYNGTVRSIVANNVFAGANINYAIYGYYMSYVDFWHNSVYGTGANYLCYWYYVQQLDVQNNIFYYTGNGNAIFTYNPSFVNWDYNDYYVTNGNVASISNTIYTTTGALKAYNSTMNQNNFEDDPQWVDPETDHHVTSKFPEMYGSNVGVSLDHDQDSRCKFAPSVGSDEFKQTQLPPVANFLKPDTAWLNSPTVLLNFNKPSKTTGAIWYLNGTMMSDSIHLEYTPSRTGYDTVTLVMENCTGKDSITKTVFVSPIVRAPKVDFASSSKDVYTGDVITLLDLSSNGATDWLWSISPKVIYDPFLLILTRTHWYGNNDSTKANPTVYFDYPGVYEIKLKVSNSFGADSIVRTAYIKVRQKSTMCDIPSDTDGSYGTLFDNGGQNGNYSAGLNGINSCVYSISSCKGEIDMDISQFDLGTGDYLRIYDGEDVDANPLWDVKNYPDGMNGNKSDASVKLKLTAKSGSAYFVFTSDNNVQTTGKGFAIDWEISPTTWTSPLASINMPDTACLGFPTVFENASIGNWSYVEWDLDNDNTIDGYGNEFSHTFTTSGYHTIKLSAASLCAPKDSIIKTIFIEGATKAPKPDFTTSETLVAAGDTVMIDGVSDYCTSEYEYTITPATYLLAANTTRKDASIQVIFLKGGFYDVQLRSTNSFGSDSIIRVNHIQVLDYCTPAVSNLDTDLGISRVVFGDIDNSSQSAGLDYNNYLDQSTTVEKGPKYKVTVERATANKLMSRKVWIDWNIDGDFDDAFELAASEAPSRTLSFSDSIEIPSSAKPGMTRMRVSTNYSNMQNLACGPHQFGEFEDYTIYVSSQDKTAPLLELIGNDSYTIEVGSTWSEPGFTAKDLLDGDITSDVVVIGKVNPNRVNTYELIYEVEDDAKNKVSLKRMVDVVDTKSPTLALNGSDTIRIDINTAYTDLGAVASDNYDKNLVIITLNPVDTTVIGFYTVSYCVTDSSGNGAVCINRTVEVYDETNPTLALVGNLKEVVEVYSVYNDAGYTVSDNDDYTLAFSGSWTGSTDVLGTYNYIITAKDNAGNNVSVTREIEIVDTEAPLISLKGDVLVEVIRWSEYTDEGYELSDNYYDVTSSDVTVTEGGDFENTQSVGIYELTYTAKDASDNKSNAATRVISVIEHPDPIGMEEFKATGLAVYPNPSEGNVNLMISVSNRDKVEIQVVDALGRILKTYQTMADEMTITPLDLSDLTSGSYFIEVTGGEFHAVKTINITK